MGTQNWVELFSGLDDLSLDYENYNWNKNQILWKKKKSGPQNRNYIYFVLQSSKNMHMILIIASVVGFLKEIDICNFPYFEPPNCEWNEQNFF